MPPQLRVVFLPRARALLGSCADSRKQHHHDTPRAVVDLAYSLASGVSFWCQARRVGRHFRDGGARFAPVESVTKPTAVWLQLWPYPQPQHQKFFAADASYRHHRAHQFLEYQLA